MPPVSMARMNFAFVRKPRCSTAEGIPYAPEPNFVQSTSRGLPVPCSRSRTTRSPATRPPCSSGRKPELLLVEAVVGLDVVHDRVGLDLLVAPGVVPVLGLVVGVALGGEVVGLDQLLRERDHPQRLGEGLHRGDGEGPLLLLPRHLEVALAGGVADVREAAERELHRGLAALDDAGVDLPTRIDDAAHDGAGCGLGSGQSRRNPLGWEPGESTTRGPGGPAGRGSGARQEVELLVEELGRHLGPAEQQLLVLRRRSAGRPSAGSRSRAREPPAGPPPLRPVRREVRSPGTCSRDARS